MAEFDEKLNSILSNPDAMSQIMQLAQSLSGGSGPASPPPPPQPDPPRQTPPWESPSAGVDRMTELLAEGSRLDNFNIK